MSKMKEQIRSTLPQKKYKLAPKELDPNNDIEETSGVGENTLKVERQKSITKSNCNPLQEKSSCRNSLVD